MGIEAPEVEPGRHRLSGVQTTYRPRLTDAERGGIWHPALVLDQRPKNLWRMVSPEQEGWNLQ